MIFVMLGTQKNSFNRLLEEIQKCIDNKIIQEEVIVQAGTTKIDSKDMEMFDIVSNDELNNYISQARFIICHGGVGSILSAIKQGKKVIAVPRLSKYGEHVNDHQIQMVETFNEQGFIKGIMEVSDLENAIKGIDEFEPQKFVSNNKNFLEIIENFIDNN